MFKNLDSKAAKNRSYAHRSCHKGERAVSLVHNLPQFVQAVSKDSVEPIVAIAFNTLRLSRMQKSTQDILSAIDNCFKNIDGEISYNLQTTMTSICQFSNMREASQFLDEVEDAFKESEQAGLTATLYHHGVVVARVEQVDNQLVTRIVQ